ncbi:hypothetical protein DERF_010052 [Dermatophagoides farinae]|uniref:Uncharacterized protein n=1 Tax=Dermatophagoides farinae TaxID=6954 RepID=A0A922HY53_DERFA|nr:hypothetical protein DERF_010052 [Dermatophagoides farinae]
MEMEWAKMSNSFLYMCNFIHELKCICFFQGLRGFFLLCSQIKIPVIVQPMKEEQKKNCD